MKRMLFFAISITCLVVGIRLKIDTAASDSVWGIALADGFLIVFMLTFRAWVRM